MRYLLSSVTGVAINFLLQKQVSFKLFKNVAFPAPIMWFGAYTDASKIVSTIIEVAAWNGAN